jgi:hypothetical protein
MEAENIIKKTEREVRKMDRILEKLKRVELQEFTNYLHSPWRIFWANFLAGTARGLGFLIGAALILTIVGLLITKILGNIPIVGEFFQAINHWITQAVSESKTLSPQP